MFISRFENEINLASDVPDFVALLNIRNEILWCFLSSLKYEKHELESKVPSAISGKVSTSRLVVNVIPNIDLDSAVQKDLLCVTYQEFC